MGFAPDPDAGAGIFRGRPIEKTRREKQNRVYTLAAATDKHQATAQMVSEDVPTGSILTQHWSSMWTPARKAETLARIDALHRAVKSARMRANEATVPMDGIFGEALVQYAFGT